MRTRDIAFFLISTSLAACQVAPSREVSREALREPAVSPSLDRGWLETRLDEPENSPSLNEALERTRELERRDRRFAECRVNRVSSWEPLERELLLIRSRSWSEQELRRRYPFLGAPEIECLADGSTGDEI